MVKPVLFFCILIRRVLNFNSQEQRPELATADSSQTVSPKFDKKKRCVARESLLEQGEKIMNELASNRAMLEIHYENEVQGYGDMRYGSMSYCSCQ